MLDCAFFENKNIILMGDFNINLMLQQDSWMNTIQYHNLTQIINIPTRITFDSESILDHFYTNNTQLISEICVPISGISDHLPTFCTLHEKFYKVPKSHTSVTYRSFKHFNESEFLNDIQSADFSHVYAYSNPEDALQYWINLFYTIINKHAPIKNKRIKQEIKPPWLSKEILAEMRHRDYLRQKGDRDSYKSQRNKVKKSIRSAKRLYIRNLIEDKSNPSAIWKAINLLKNKKQSAPDFPFHPNDFNDHFSNIATKLLKIEEKNNPETNDSIYDKLRTFVATKINNNDHFKIPYLTIMDVAKYIKSLKTSCSPGIDDISCKLLKLAAPLVIDSLTFIYNQCISSGIFPNCLKSAKVIPLHKKGSYDDLNNFRPISILPAVSKPLEKHIHFHLSKFLETNNLIHSNQSAFRPGLSCQTALTKLIQDFHDGCNQRNLSGVVFVDLAKAFDMLDHRILLEKLAFYNLDDSALTLLTSYVSQRTQTVCLKGKYSATLPVSNGIPQGSVLGPLLFTLYINDLPLHISSTSCDLFADDTTLHCTDVTVESIEMRLNQSLTELEHWCRSNSMIVNPQKSESMLIASRQKMQLLQTKNLSLSYNNIPIPAVESHTILVVILDKNLQWSAHVDFVCKKIAISNYQLNCIKNFVDENIRRIFYFAYIQPSIDFCLNIWGNCAETHINRVFSQQKTCHKNDYSSKIYF